MYIRSHEYKIPSSIIVETPAVCENTPAIICKMNYTQLRAMTERRSNEYFIRKDTVAPKAPFKVYIYGGVKERSRTQMGTPAITKCYIDDAYSVTCASADSVVPKDCTQLSQRIIGECTCTAVIQGYMSVHNYKYNVSKQVADGMYTDVTKSCLTPVIVPLQSHKQPVCVEGSICTLTDFKFYKKPISEKEFEVLYPTFRSTCFNKKQSSVLISDSACISAIAEKSINAEPVQMDGFKPEDVKTEDVEKTVEKTMLTATDVKLKASTQELLALAVKVTKAFTAQNVPITVSDALDIAEKLYARNVRCTT